jgi:hypothetical protein
MLVFLITSLPRLSILRKPTISKHEFIERTYSCLSNKDLKDLNLLIKLDQDNKVKAQNLQTKKSDVVDTECKSFYRENLLNLKSQTNSKFLIQWVTYIINFKEIITGLLCKKKNLPLDIARKQFESYSSPTTLYMLKNYGHDDLAMLKRCSWINQLLKGIHTNSLEDIEKLIILLQLKEIDYLKQNDIFHADTILAYYLEISLLEKYFGFNQQLGHDMIKNILKTITI